MFQLSYWLCALWVPSQAPLRLGILNCCNQLVIYFADLPDGTVNSAGNDVSSETGDGKVWLADDSGWSQRSEVSKNKNISLFYMPWKQSHIVTKTNKVVTWNALTGELRQNGVVTVCAFVSVSGRVSCFILKCLTCLPVLVLCDYLVCLTCVWFPHLYLVSSPVYWPLCCLLGHCQVTCAVYLCLIVCSLSLFSVFVSCAVPAAFPLDCSLFVFFTELLLWSWFDPGCSGLVVFLWPCSQLRYFVSFSCLSKTQHKFNINPN